MKYLKPINEGLLKTARDRISSYEAQNQIRKKQLHDSIEEYRKKVSNEIEALGNERTNMWQSLTKEVTEQVNDIMQSLLDEYEFEIGKPSGFHHLDYFCRIPFNESLINEINRLAKKLETEGLTLIVGFDWFVHMSGTREYSQVYSEFQRFLKTNRRSFMRKSYPPELTSLRIIDMTDESYQKLNSWI